ncbi:hypothetical protein NBRGN_054_00360 [Nocardia brasiliensis NBRC 14402]|uniref:hypothetical protein n=1 Tax=Nocardia brasiliensis TaxID=37326 RepID=UPI00031D9AA0|nr:hypothetical protein [Nocardia brasiliensis]ASF06235.1 hypothetical protein CEQ30_01470 [Nocardia brasiliensis]GAJ82332.1 hypothetical protein NBRGN_054_00360 [Nocardia brasiliensis NBRC 14402]SUB53913.1 Uncharacterised protein [Nocardia brasiliensis]
MRVKGISYDTGFLRDGKFSRTRFDPMIVERELRIIRDDLHCNAVRLIGGDAGRLELAATIAAELGLIVWFSPYPLESSVAEMLALFADCAERAERIRRGGAEVVFVTGAELSLMAPGFLPGGTVEERLAALLRPEGRAERLRAAGEAVNEVLGKAVALVRERFEGPVTYASIQFERIDWSLFDIVAVDLYRSAEVADRFQDGVRALVEYGKPVAITEFGSATYRGAGDRGAQGLDVVEYDSQGPVRLIGAYERDEAGQAAYLGELLEIFDTEGVAATFVFVFALYDHVHRPGGDPRDDLDLASYGIVKTFESGGGHTYPDMPWEPKAAFATLATFYAAS